MCFVFNCFFVYNRFIFIIIVIKLDNLFIYIFEVYYEMGYNRSK